MQLTDLSLMVSYVIGSFLTGYAAGWLLYVFRKVSQNL